jgi:hypothetical protein
MASRPMGMPTTRAVTATLTAEALRCLCIRRRRPVLYYVRQINESNDADVRMVSENEVPDRDSPVGKESNPESPWDLVSGSPLYSHHGMEVLFGSFKLTSSHRPRSSTAN